MTRTYFNRIRITAPLIGYGVFGLVLMAWDTLTAIIK